MIGVNKAIAKKYPGRYVEPSAAPSRISATKSISGIKDNILRPPAPKKIILLTKINGNLRNGIKFITKEPPIAKTG